MVLSLGGSDVDRIVVDVLCEVFPHGPDPVAGPQPATQGVGDHVDGGKKFSSIHPHHGRHAKEDEQRRPILEAGCEVAADGRGG